MSTEMESRLARLEGGYEQIDHSLMDLRQDIVGLRQEMVQRFNAVDRKFTLLFGTIAGTWITTILTILFHR